MCTTFEYINHKIKAKANQESLKKHKVELQVHKGRAKVYYDIIRRKKDRPDTHNVAFDLLAVQVLPKVPIHKAYYSRQLGLYSLGFVMLVMGKTIPLHGLKISQTWGSNEIVSAVHNYLGNISPQISPLSDESESKRSGRA